MGRQQLPCVLKSLVERLKKCAAAEGGQNAQENRKSAWSSGVAPSMMGVEGLRNERWEGGGVRSPDLKQSKSEGRKGSSVVTMWRRDLST